MTIGEERYQEDRRATERRFDEVWRMFDRLGEQIIGLIGTMDRHVVICTKDAEVRERSQEQIAERIGDLTTAVDTLTETARRRAWTRRLLRTIFTVFASVVGTLGTTVAGFWALWEHLGPWLSRILKVTS